VPGTSAPPSTHRDRQTIRLPEGQDLNTPQITLQIVHIDGPRKGEIDEFTKPVVTVGRLPSCDVVFPKDLRFISRTHAEIKREGNRFLLINRSPNGCFVNGQPVDQVYLKQGDVITFAEGGPKASFLYTVTSAPVQQGIRTAPQTPVKPSPPPPPPPDEKGPFTLQYGTTIKSLEQVSVRLGADAGNDFVIRHDRVFGTHAEVYYHTGQVFLRDLTQSGQTLLNGSVLHSATPLQSNDVITFAEGGPSLKYLGTGRFVEVIE
jgi:pSer/pThr/pTyr-binding forkhead associated (FHA) protein